MIARMEKTRMEIVEVIMIKKTGRILAQKELGGVFADS